MKSSFESQAFSCRVRSLWNDHVSPKECVHLPPPSSDPQTGACSRSPERGQSVSQLLAPNSPHRRGEVSPDALFPSVLKPLETHRSPVSSDPRVPEKTASVGPASDGCLEVTAKAIPRRCVVTGRSFPPQASVFSAENAELELGWRLSHSIVPESPPTGGPSAPSSNPVTECLSVSRFPFLINCK